MRRNFTNRSRISGTLAVAGVLMTSSLAFAWQQAPRLLPAENRSPSAALRAEATPPPLPVPSITLIHTATIAAGIPLRVQVDHRYRLRTGTAITGKLTDPVYAGDHIVLPAGTPIYGKIVHLIPADTGTRTWAMLDGDITPLKIPEIEFDSIQLPDGTREALSTEATERTAGVVHMAGAPKKQSIKERAQAMYQAKKQSVKDAMHSQHKSDTALKFLYGQLPYHPQEIWSGTQFDAELTAPLTLPDPEAASPMPITPPDGHIPSGIVEARLTTGISSATSKTGSPVEAVLTQPYMDASHTHVILPTGTRLVGTVQQAKPARSFGRTGTLRFTFRQIQLPEGTMQRVHSQMTAVEGSKGQNVTVDSEGGAHANADKGKYLAPLLLGLMAGNSLDADQTAFHSGASSNGFGIVARVASLALVTPTVTAGFAYYALSKSITRRWVMRGHDVVFAKNTRMEMNISDR